MTMTTCPDSSLYEIITTYPMLCALSPSASKDTPGSISWNRASRSAPLFFAQQHDELRLLCAARTCHLHLKVGTAVVRTAT